jgi:hypothetical protein
LRCGWIAGKRCDRALRSGGPGKALCLSAKRCWRRDTVAKRNIPVIVTGVPMDEYGNEWRAVGYAASILMDKEEAAWTGED